MTQKIAVLMSCSSVRMGGVIQVSSAVLEGQIRVLIIGDFNRRGTKKKVLCTELIGKVSMDTKGKKTYPW